MGRRTTVLCLPSQLPGLPNQSGPLHLDESRSAAQLRLPPGAPGIPSPSALHRAARIPPARLALDRRRPPAHARGAVPSATPRLPRRQRQFQATPPRSPFSRPLRRSRGELPAGPPVAAYRRFPLPLRAAQGLDERVRTREDLGLVAVFPSHQVRRRPVDDRAPSGSRRLAGALPDGALESPGGRPALHLVRSGRSGSWCPFDPRKRHPLCGRSTTRSSPGTDRASVFATYSPG